LSPGASTFPLSVVEREGRTRPVGAPNEGSFGDRIEAAADASRGAGLKPDEPTDAPASSDITVRVLGPLEPRCRPEEEPSSPLLMLMLVLVLVPGPPMLSETVGSASVSQPDTLVGLLLPVVGAVAVDGGGGGGTATGESVPYNEFNRSSLPPLLPVLLLLLRLLLVVEEGAAADGVFGVSVASDVVDEKISSKSSSAMVETIYTGTEKEDRKKEEG